MATKDRPITFLVVWIAFCVSALAVTARAGEPQSRLRPLPTTATKALPERGEDDLTLVTSGPTIGRSLRLAEFTVFRLPDREIRLRLTLRSVPPPQFMAPGDGDPTASVNRSLLVTMDVGALIFRHSQRSGS